MNPSKVERSRVASLTDLPNIGEACAKDLRLIGIHNPAQLVGRDPLRMYRELCDKTGIRHDPCMLDVFMSVTSFMNGEEPRPWWKFTASRKHMLGA